MGDGVSMLPDMKQSVLVLVLTGSLIEHYGRGSS